MKPAFLAVLALMALGGVFLVARARQGPPAPRGGAEEYAAAYQGLCSARSLVEEDLGRARDVFYGQAHTTLHLLADETTEKSRPLAARLLEAKNRTEQYLGGTEPANAAAAMDDLLAVSREALIFLGVPARCDH
jgi:hypothetical protein